MKRAVCAVLMLIFVGAASAGEWHIETVDSEGDVGSWTSIALDSSDYPHICYRDSIKRDLKYACWNGTAWLIETVDSHGFQGSLKVDAFDQPHISYNDSTNDELKYAWRDAAIWHIETVDTNMYSDPRTPLALDSRGYPHILYGNISTFDLKYAWWDGENWQLETVPTGTHGFSFCLALDSSDFPHILYYVRSPEDEVTYARWDGSSWKFEVVKYLGNLDAQNMCLALDSHDNPHICYNVHYSSNNLGDYYLEYVSRDGEDWQFEIIDESYCDSTSSTISLVMDSSDCPRLAYSESDQLYARRLTGGGWLISTVDSDGNYYCSSLALDSCGLPHISYYDYVNQDLKYAYMMGIEGVDISTSINDEGVLVTWVLIGEKPVSITILRSAGENEPAVISGALPGEASRWLDTDVDAGVAYRYWLETTDGDGTVSRFGPSEAVTFPGAARELALSIYPSPASGEFTVDYTLPENGRISISLYDLSGRRITTFFDGETAAGRHDVSFNASTLPSGVYLVHLDATTGTLTRRVVIAR